MKTAEVEFKCRNCGRVTIEHWPEDTDFDELDKSFEHDFDCSELDVFDEED